MELTNYSLGIATAILAGIILNIGTILEKMAINKLPDNTQSMKSLLRNPIWLTGFFLQYIFGTIFIFIAQLYIGPILIPGLLAFGLVILTLGSVMINKEQLNLGEYAGICMMVIAIFLISFSGLSIELLTFNYLHFNFLLRAFIFSGLLFLFVGCCIIFQRKKLKYKGLLLAFSSGLLFSIENLWFGIIILILANFYQGAFLIADILLFTILIFFEIVINIYGMIFFQKSFRYGQASNLVPILSVPVQLTPIIIYFFVFLLIPRNILSIIFLMLGINFILISSYFLSQRQIE
jgi:hypothetical protein